MQSIGKGSQVIARAIARHAAENPGFAARLSAPARFLDVGSGAGWISIEAARLWPALQVDGIDIFDPALAIAARNLAASAVADRVRFRKLDVTELTAEPAYAFAFLAAPFIPQDIIPAALDRLREALEPGGLLFFGIFVADPAPLPQALLNLRITRFGGHPWSVGEATELMRAAGFSVEPEPITEAPARLVIGRRG